jgi:LPXTG-motif cell wall-anchored protein
MKRIGLALLAGVLAVAGLLVMSPAQAYPSVTVTISDITVVGGTKIVIKADTDPAVNCTWRLTYNAKTGAKTVTGSGPSISHVFNTRKVSKIVHETASASCTYDDASLPQTAGAVGAAPAAVVAALQTVSTTGNVTLLPLRDGDDDDDSDDSDDSDDDDGNLPNTGGERLAWLIIGLLLVIAGAAVVASSRKRSHA